jgi:hypothetical protein
MQIGHLIDLTNDASDLLDFFDGVETQEQLVSRLERLKRGPIEELLACITGLRASNQQFRDDTVEPSGSIDGDEPEENELEELMLELESTDRPHTPTEMPPSSPDENPSATTAGPPSSPNGDSSATPVRDPAPTASE